MNRNNYEVILQKIVIVFQRQNIKKTLVINMHRLCLLIFINILSNIAIFAQRGKVRPEWDFDGGKSVSHHNIDDDLYSTLFFFGIILFFFLCCYLYGVFVGRPKEQARIRLEMAQEEEINKRLVYVFKKNTMSFNDEKVSEDVFIKKGERCIIVKIYGDNDVAVEMLDRGKDKRHLYVERDDIELE